jgi:hypothetical protein
MRRSGYPSGNGLFFLLGDHLGSTAIQTTSNGSLSASMKYKPWGGERDSSGTMRTTFRFTGQRAETDLTVPLGYPVTGASTGSGEGGTVVSDVEIRYDWQTSGEFVSNHFTLQKHYRAGAGLLWKVYYGGNVLRVEGGLTSLNVDSYFPPNSATIRSVKVVTNRTFAVGWRIGGVLAGKSRQNTPNSP